VDRCGQLRNKVYNDITNYVRFKAFTENNCPKTFPHSHAKEELKSEYLETCSVSITRMKPVETLVGLQNVCLKYTLTQPTARKYFSAIIILFVLSRMASHFAGYLTITTVNAIAISSTQTDNKHLL
jgi:hypothetical protein